MKKIEQLSFFIPFWNEEKNIEKVLENVLSHIDKTAKNWEIIIVDDGSDDDTLKIANKLALKEKRIKVVSHKANRGYGAALKSGFKNAFYNVVAFMDGDGQFDFSEIGRLSEKIDHADIVIGYREKRYDHPFRHLLMNMLKVWDLFLFGFYFKDIDCGFKMFTRRALKKILPLSAEGAMISTEILARAKKNKLKIIQARVSHHPRKYGNQSGGNPRVVLRAIKETFVIKNNLYGRT